MGLKEAEGIDFKYTTMSLDDVYGIGLKHALDNITRNSGKINGDQITINVQSPLPVRFERSFPGLFPSNKIPVKWSDNKEEISFNYEGTGFVLRGETANWGSSSNYVFETELYIDGKLVEKPALPASYTTRRYELCWKYELPQGKHEVKLKILNPSKELNFRSYEAIVYSDQAKSGIRK